MILRNPSEKLRPIFTYKCQMINIKIFYSILQGVPPKKWVLLLVIVAVNPTFFWDTLYKGYMCVGKSNIYVKNWPHILVKFKRILEPHSSQRMSDRYQSKGDEINIIMTSLFMISWFINHDFHFKSLLPWLNDLCKNILFPRRTSDVSQLSYLRTYQSNFRRNFD